MTEKLANVDLNLLVALHTLLEERNVTRAAERLYVGQSAMSSTLARLRRLFDDPLLVREGRRLVATPLAESLVRPVGEALGIVESMLRSRTTFDPTVDRRTFTITASDYVTLVVLHPLLVHLAEAAPGVTVHLRPLEETDFLEELRTDRTDLLILPRQLLPGRLPHPNRLLFEDPYLVAVDADHPDVGDTFSMEQMATLPYLTYRHGNQAALVDDQLDLADVERNVEVTARTFLIGPMLLRDTRLFMLIHSRLGEYLAERLRLRLLPPPLELEPVREIMVWTSAQEADAGHVWLREQVMSVIPSDLAP